MNTFEWTFISAHKCLGNICKRSGERCKGPESSDKLCVCTDFYTKYRNDKQSNGEFISYAGNGKKYGWGRIHPLYMLIYKLACIYLEQQ